MISMLKKIILTFTFLTFSIQSPTFSSWLSSAENAFKSAGSSAFHAAEGAASGAANAAKGALQAAGSVGLQAAAQLQFCRTLASVPGGVNSLQYQSQCGNMAFVCQQMMLSNPQIGVDPYCATVSGFGQMTGPWGGNTAPFIPGVNSSTTPTNADPSTIGWSVPAPPPYGFAMGFGAYGVPPTSAAGVGALVVSSLFNKFFGGSSNNSGGYGSSYGNGGYGGYGYPGGGYGPSSSGSGFLNSVEGLI